MAGLTSYIVQNEKPLNVLADEPQYMSRPNRFPTIITRPTYSSVVAFLPSSLREVFQILENLFELAGTA